MKRRTNVARLGLYALAVLALVAVTGCGAQNPMAPTTDAGSSAQVAPSSNDLVYDVGTIEGGSAGSGTGTLQDTGGSTPQLPGRRLGWQKHGRH
jgi:hypothetical protein